jgi:predicted TIM-barrel fold metal-dependent hydrolase
MGAADAWAQITTDRFVEQPWLTTLFRWTREESPKATSASVTIKAMNDGGVDVALISAWHGPNGSLVSNDDVADAVKAFPDRLVVSPRWISRTQWELRERSAAGPPRGLSG